jgi:hypothetical protein
MPHDRRTGRVFLAMMGLVGVAVSVGCMRSSNLRSSAGTLPELSPAGELHPVAGEATPGTSSPAPANASASWTRPAVTPPPRPAGDPGPNPAGSTATSPPPGGPAASPAPGGTDPLDAPARGGPPSASPVPAGELPAPPTILPTPLLDAEIRRAQAINRQHIESLRAPETRTPEVDPVNLAPSRSPTEPEPTPTTTTEPKTAELKTKPAEPDLDAVAPLPLAASPRAAVEPETAGSPGGTLVPPLIPIDPPAAGSAPPATVPPHEALTTDNRGLPPNQVAAIADAGQVNRRDEEPMPSRPKSGAPDDSKVAFQQVEERPSAPGDPPAHADREQRPPLDIAALRLCSKVTGFGEFEPVNPDAVKPGQRVRVYCEMAGLEYRSRGDAFVSRLAAHLELRPETDGPVLWELSPGTAEDLCRRPRRDYYVSYLVEFPMSLGPGAYRLRLIQTDLMGNRATSREIPVTIVR